MQKCERCFLRTDTNTSIEKIFFLESSLQSFSESDRNFFWLSAKNPRKDCQKCYLRVQKHVEKTDFSIFFFLLCNRTLSKTFLTFGIKFSTKLSTCSDKHFEEKKRFWKIGFFLIFKKKVFRILTRTIRQSCKNCLLSLQRDNLMKAVFFQKIFSFCCVIEVWAIFFAIWHKIFRKFVKSAFYVFRRTLWWKKKKKNLFWNTLLHFFHFDRNHFWVSAKFFKKRLSKPFSRCSNNISRKHIYWFFFVIGTYSNFEQSFPDICLKIVRKVDKTAF